MHHFVSGTAGSLLGKKINFSHHMILEPMFLEIEENTRPSKISDDMNL